MAGASGFVPGTEYIPRTHSKQISLRVEWLRQTVRRQCGQRSAAGATQPSIAHRDMLAKTASWEGGRIPRDPAPALTVHAHYRAGAEEAWRKGITTRCDSDHNAAGDTNAKGGRRAALLRARLASDQKANCNDPVKVRPFPATSSSAVRLSTM